MFVSVCVFCMRMCVCVPVRVYTRVLVFMSISVYVRACVLVCVCSLSCVCVCVGKYTLTHIYLHAYGRARRVRKYLCTNWPKKHVLLQHNPDPTHAQPQKLRALLTGRFWLRWGQKTFCWSEYGRKWRRRPQKWVLQCCYSCLPGRGAGVCWHTQGKCPQLTDSPDIEQFSEIVIGDDTWVLPVRCQWGHKHACRYNDHRRARTCCSPYAVHTRSIQNWRTEPSKQEKVCGQHGMCWCILSHHTCATVIFPW